MREKVAIEFSGGRDSVKLLKMYRNKKSKPLLLCFIHNGMETFKDLLTDYVKIYGFKIKFVIDLKARSFSSEYGVHPNDEIFAYRDCLISTAKKLGITILINGRKRTDLIEDVKLKNPQEHAPQLVCDGIKMVFPLWEYKEEKKRES